MVIPFDSFDFRHIRVGRSSFIWCAYKINIIILLLCGKGSCGVMLTSHLQNCSYIHHVKKYLKLLGAQYSSGRETEKQSGGRLDGHLTTTDTTSSSATT